MKDFPVITTTRLLLRQFVEADLENVYRGLSHPEIINYYGISFDSLEATKAQLKWFAELEKNQTGNWWAACSRDNTIFHGAVGLYNLDAAHKKAEIGFWLVPDSWNKGIMTEAIPLIYEYGFNQLRLHRIEGFVETENVNCKKLMSKLQFYHEGTMKDCEIKNARYISLDIYAMVNKDL